LLSRELVKKWQVHNIGPFENSYDRALKIKT
jgi:hypothetical protein